MKLLKTASGLLEVENFFFTSPMTDFIGENQFTRDSESFTLISGNIERLVNEFENFSIHVDVDIHLTQPTETASFYLRENTTKYGIVADSSTSQTWVLNKLGNLISAEIYEDDFVDGWDYYGAPQTQGFEIQKQPNSESYLKLLSYKMYKSPFITIDGLYHNDVVKLYNDSGTLISENEVSNQGFVEIKIPQEGSYTIEVVGVYTTDLILIAPGDTFCLTTVDVSLIYNGVELDYTHTHLNSRTEKLLLVNNSNHSVSNLHFSIVNYGNHIIQLSQDFENFSENLIIDVLQPLEQKDLWVKIERNPETPIGCRYEQFEISLTI